MRALDFTTCKNGVLVKRTLHWFIEHAIPKFDAKRDQIGIVVGLEFHQDGNGQLVAFPVIHWEGELEPSMTHPANARPYRRTVRLRRLEIEE